MRMNNPDYRDIFERRGEEYHQAMTRYPRARRREFEHMLALVRPSAGERLLDMPSGGGYLEDYLCGTDVSLIAVETSSVFHARAAERTGLETRLCALNAVPLDDDSADAIVSLAGLHHVEDRSAVFGEMKRLLSGTGRLCLADVKAESGPARFLDVFVNDHSSLGHSGRFVDDTFRAELRGAGFNIESDHDISYDWHFDDAKAMTDYCRLLFGIDRAGRDEILSGIGRHLDYAESGGECRMRWSLTFIRCRPSNGSALAD